jgi:hypothetical protein
MGVTTANDQLSGYLTIPGIKTVKKPSFLVIITVPMLGMTAFAVY